MIKNIINRYDIFKIKQAMLKKIDKDLVDHGIETSYIAGLIGKELKFSEQRIHNLRIASLIHDIGAYKTEEINNLKQFEIVDTGKHAIYGYSILNQMNELSNLAPIVLYHHHSYDNKDSYIEGIEIPEEAFIISLSDRVAVFCKLLNYEESKIVQAIENINKSLFKPKHLEVLFKLIKEKSIIKKIIDSSYKSELSNFISKTKLEMGLVKEYLIFLPLAIDFFSYETSLHTVSISSMAKKICEKINLDSLYKDKIEISAYLHDLGKVCMPSAILHKDGKLTEHEFDIMKEHVTYTREILIESGIKQELIDLACNHHERLDGSGYDRGLTGKELSIGDRIISISDIFCALTEKRQYKEAYGKDVVISILSEMANNNHIDIDIVNLISENYEDIDETVKNARSRYQIILKDIFNDYNYIVNEYSGLNIF